MVFNEGEHSSPNQFFCGCHSSDGRQTPESNFIERLEQGGFQTVFAFGTSLSAVDSSFWFSTLQEEVEQRFPGKTNFINRAHGGVTSDWALGFLEQGVIAHVPDVVFIEFAINDASIANEISLEQSQSNLEGMLDRIAEALPDCEVILMTMNPPSREHQGAHKHYVDYYQMYRDVAVNRGVVLIDHQPNWEKILSEDPMLYDIYVPDGVHPGLKGSLAVISPEINMEVGLEPDKPLVARFETDIYKWSLETVSVILASIRG